MHACERLDRVLAAIFDPSPRKPAPLDWTDEPGQMTDRECDREYAADADFVAAAEFG